MNLGGLKDALSKVSMQFEPHTSPYWSSFKKESDSRRKLTTIERCWTEKLMLELFPSFPYWVGSSTFLQIVCPQVIRGVGDSTITRNATQRSHKMGGWESRLWSLLGGRRMLCDRKSKGGRLGTRLWCIATERFATIFLQFQPQLRSTSRVSPLKHGLGVASWAGGFHKNYSFVEGFQSLNNQNVTTNMPYVNCRGHCRA